MNWILVALLAYLAIQLAIGVWVSGRIESEDDYLVAGRRLGYPLTIFSLYATWFGAETCIASAGETYQNGFALTTAEPFAYGLTILLAGVIFAVPLWRLKLTTLADLFRMRFGPGVERVAAALIIPTSILWAAAQLRGFGHVLTTVTDLDINTAIGAAAVFCVLYTVLGGLLADAITDLVQGVFLIAGLVILAIAVVSYFGGVDAALGQVDVARIAVVGTRVDSSYLGLLEEWSIPIAGSVVAPELASRMIAARSPQLARNSGIYAGGLYIMTGLIPVGLGLVAIRIVPNLTDPEQVLPALALELLPSAGYVLFLGALISAILSTVDTTLLVAGGLAAHNVAGPLMGMTEDRAKLRLARLSVLIFGAMALVLAIGDLTVADLVEQASAFGSAGLLVIVSFGLFTRFGGPRAAMLSLLGGLVVYVAALLLATPYPYISSIAVSVGLYLAIGFAEPRHAGLRPMG